MNSVLNAITGHAAILLAVVAILEGVLAAWLFRRNDEMRMRPGGIDPEIVIQLLRSGQSPTLDVVHSLMEQREDADAAADPGEP